MKRCPKCNLNYPDETLEFCLEDGTRLISENRVDEEIQTVTRSNAPGSTTAKTVSLPFSTPGAVSHLPTGNAQIKTPAPTSALKERAVEKSNQALEIAPLVVALAHNWWQWIYLNNQYYSSFTTYVLSANFLMWLLLLAAGAVLGLLAVKRVGDKRFAIAGLVILAVNLILFLVPKR
ncbi:MAG: hypothetical protein ACR2GD_13525 [Pyrinomonadaceae bacterium]